MFCLFLCNKRAHSENVTHLMLTHASGGPQEFAAKLVSLGNPPMIKWELSIGLKSCKEPTHISCHIYHICIDGYMIVYVDIDACGTTFSPNHVDHSKKVVVFFGGHVCIYITLYTKMHAFIYSVFDIYIYI